MQVPLGLEVPKVISANMYRSRLRVVVALWAQDVAFVTLIFLTVCWKSELRPLVYGGLQLHPAIVLYFRLRVLPSNNA